MTQNQNYKYNNRYNNQPQQEKYTYSSGSSTITRSRAFTEDPVIKMQIEQIVPIYEDLFGTRGIPAGIVQFFARLIRAGMEPAVIASAIHSTGWARIPTPYYMRAILMRYMSEGIMTESQLDHDRMEHDREHYDCNPLTDGRLYPDDGNIEI